MRRWQNRSRTLQVFSPVRPLVILAAVAMLTGCGTSDKADTAEGTPAPLSGNDYLSTEFRARSRANTKLGNAQKDRSSDVREEKSFDQKSAPAGDSTP